MSPDDYFQSQASSNKWLTELTRSQQLLIQKMLIDYAIIRVEMCAKATEPTYHEPENNFADGIDS